MRREQADIARFFQRFAEYIPEMRGVAGQARLGTFPDELVGGIPQLDGTRADIAAVGSDVQAAAAVGGIALAAVQRRNGGVHLPNLDAMIENFDKALSHPDADDLERLKQAVR